MLESESEFILPIPIELRGEGEEKPVVTSITCTSRWEHLTRLV